MTRRLPKVSIVVLNWNAWQDTVACFDSLLAIDYPIYAVIIVDNRSTDSSVQEIRKWLEVRGLGHTVLGDSDREKESLCTDSKDQFDFSDKHFVLIETGKNLGYTGGNNLGIRYSLQIGADYVLVLNEDTKVSRGFLTKMVNTAERDPTVGLVGCKLCALEEPSRVQYQGGNLSFWFGVYGSFRSKTNTHEHGEIDVNFIPGCAVLIKRALLESIGPLEESYFLYVDDVEFPYRALKAGWRARVNLDSVVWHRSVPKRGRRSLSYYYYGTRNLLYFISKHLRGLQKASCLLFFLGGRLLLILQWMLRGRYEYVKATYLGALDYFCGVTGPKESRLARHDERVRVGS